MLVSHFLFLICMPLCLIAMYLHFKKLRNSQASKSKKDYLNSWDPKRRQFEKEVADYFAQNWREVVLWPWAADNWKDIVMRKWLAIYLVQCKHWYWNWFVSPKEIRDFQWAIDLYEKQHGISARWIFITSWKTTSNARETARTLWIELWDKWNRKDKINNF